MLIIIDNNKANLGEIIFNTHVSGKYACYRVLSICFGHIATLLDFVGNLWKRSRSVVGVFSPRFDALDFCFRLREAVKGHGHGRRKL